MSLKTVKVQIGFELYLFWGFYFLSKTLLKFSLRHISKTNWHNQKQNSNSCLHFDGSISSLANYVWTEVIFFLYVCFKSILDFFSEFQLGICFESFFFEQIHFGLYVFSDLQFGRFLGANWRTSILDFVFDSKPILDFILKFKPVLDFLFAFKSLLDWMFSVQIHFAFFWGLKFKYILDFVRGFNSIWDVFKVQNSILESAFSVFNPFK